jgi:hypothetical protein
MDSKNLKLLYFSTEESEIKSVNLSYKSLVALLAGLVLSILVVIGLLTAAIVKYYQNSKIAELRRQNIVLISQLAQMEGKMKEIRLRLNQLQQFDNDLRVLVDLPRIDEDMRNVGVGGTVDYRDLVLEELPDVLGDRVSSLKMDLEKLDRQIDLEFSSFREIERVLRENQQRIRHTPSIRPVNTGWLKSKFGNRLDPFVDQIRHHDGIDIAAEKGTPIFATADGVVLRVGYDPKGYGRFVVIDHGYGIRTLYGHMSRVLVKRGQRVRRWEKIGEVGKTGRATGYHIHYEVAVNGRPVNPLNFILNW